MKKNSVLILGIVSIIILISVQVLIIRSIWKQKDEMFALRYTLLSQEALSFINRRSPTDGFDTVRFLLSKYSEQANSRLPAIKNEVELDSEKKEILEFFTRVINQEQDLSGLLSSYFERRGFEKNFQYSIIINNLDLINDDSVVVFQRGNAPPRADQRLRKKSLQDNPRSRILVNRFRMEDNNYSLFFDYYIDFSDKQRLILREISASLFMSIFSIMAVVLIFMVTYRNMAEEKRLSDLKTDFINNMTHELKTPLSTITVAGKTLEMEQIRNNDEKILETAKLIGKQSIHLNKLINMILEISMWERTQFQLDKKTIEIEELMNDVVESFKSGIGNGASIYQKYDFRGAKVDLDIVYFTTLINNLLSNAVKYSDKDPIINIEGFTSDNKICIKITDNGIGINRSDQKHIFDKFYRASTGNIHKYKGLGLGLYYVKNIATAHGGDVTVTSKQGKGSIFTVTIPS